MESKQELVNALRAGFSFFYAPTEEMERTSILIKEAVEGFVNKQGEQPYEVIFWDIESDEDPDSVTEWLDSKPVGTVVVAKNWNWWLNDKLEGPNKRYVQFLQNRCETLSSKDYRRALVIISDQQFDQAIPESLQGEFMKIAFGLPDESEITDIYGNIIEAAKDLPGFEEPDDENADAIVENAKGLTRHNVQSAISMGVIAGGGKIDPRLVGSFRARKIEDIAGLRVGTPVTDPLLGYDEVKKFALASVNHDLAKGILLVGPPGTGKTHFGKWLASQCNKTFVEMEMARMQGEGLYGQAEQAWAKVIDTLKALGRQLLFIDEIEKGLPQANKGQGTDQTAQRSASQFLKFLSDDRPPGCYVIATCNSINVPPEWVRAERWDCAPFYVGLPEVEERQAIYEHYLEYFEVEPGKLDANQMDGWSGGEIRSVCRLAKIHNTTCDKTRQYIIPVSKTMSDEIDALSKWAANRTIPASTKYDKNGSKAKRQRSVEL